MSDVGTQEHDPDLLDESMAQGFDSFNIQMVRRLVQD